MPARCFLMLLRCSAIAVALIADPGSSPRLGAGEPLSLPELKGWKVSHMVTTLTMSRDGNILIAGDRGGILTLFDPKTGKKLRQIQTHEGLMWGVAMSSDNQYLAFYGRFSGSCSTICELRRNFLFPVAEEVDGWVSKIAFQPGTRTLASGGYRTIVLQDILKQKPSRTLAHTMKGTGCLHFTAKGQSLASSHGDGPILLWDLQTGKAIKTLRGARGSIRTMAVSPEEHYLAAGGFDPIVRIWDIRSEKELFALDGHSRTVDLVAYLESGKRLLSCSWDAMNIWDTQTGKCLTNLKVLPVNSLGCFAISPDGRTLFAAYHNTILRFSVGREIAPR